MFFKRFNGLQTCSSNGLMVYRHVLEMFKWFTCSLNGLMVYRHVLQMVKWFTNMFLKWLNGVQTCSSNGVMVYSHFLQNIRDLHKIAFQLFIILICFPFPNTFKSFTFVNHKDNCLQVFFVWYFDVCMYVYMLATIQATPFNLWSRKFGIPFLILLY